MGLSVLILVVALAGVVAIRSLRLQPKADQVNPYARRRDLDSLVADALDKKPTARSTAVQAEQVQRMTPLEEAQQAAERLNADDKALLLAWLQAELGEQG